MLKTLGMPSDLNTSDAGIKTILDGCKSYSIRWMHGCIYYVIPDAIYMYLVLTLPWSDEHCGPTYTKNALWLKKNGLSYGMEDNYYEVVNAHSQYS